MKLRNIVRSSFLLYVNCPHCNSKVRDYKIDLPIGLMELSALTIGLLIGMMR